MFSSQNLPVEGRRVTVHDQEDFGGEWEYEVVVVWDTSLPRDPSGWFYAFLGPPLRWVNDGWDQVYEGPAAWYPSDALSYKVPSWPPNEEELAQIAILVVERYRRDFQKDDIPYDGPRPNLWARLSDQDDA